MAYTRVTDDDREDKGVTGLADVPQLSTTEMQEKFDELGNLGIDALNNLMDELEAETGAASMGVEVPSTLTADADMQSVVDALATLGSELSEDSHTHDNLTTLDAITSGIKTGYDRLVSVLTDIDTVSNGVTDDSTVLPTGHAIVNYVSAMGGGDMSKATYDADEDGIVDNAEAVQGHTVTEDSTAITDPDDTTGEQLPTAAAQNEVYEALTASIATKIAISSIETSLSSSTDTVPASSLLNTVNTSLTDTIESLAEDVFKRHAQFTLVGSGSSASQDVSLEVGHLYLFISTCHKLTSNVNPGAIAGTIGLNIRYMDYYETVSSGTSTWNYKVISKDIITPNSNSVFTNNASSQTVTVLAKSGYQVDCTVLELEL